MTIGEIAERLGRSVSYIWRLVHVFDLPSVGTRGRARLYDFDSFKAQYDAGAYYV